MSTPAPPASRSPLEIAVRRDGDEVRITLEGELDHHTCESLRRVVHCAVAAGATSVVFDCSALDFLDAGGIRVFGDTADLTDRRGGTATLVGPGAFAVRLLEIADLRDRLVVR